MFVYFYLNSDGIIKPRFSHIYGKDGRIKLGLKPGSRKIVDHHLSTNFKQYEDTIDIEETCIEQLCNDIWELKVGSTVEPVQFIDICRILQEPALNPQEIIQQRRSGTLGCFANDKKTQKYFAITAQHIFSNAPLERDKVRYIFSKVSKSRDQNMQLEETAMLSTQSSGLQRVQRVEDKSYSLDISMMPLSKSLNNVGTVRDTGEMHIENNIAGGTEVFKEGITTGKTRGEVVSGNVLCVYPRLGSEESGVVFFVKSVDSETPFAKPGDSGSLVYMEKDGRKHALGILAAVSKPISSVEVNNEYICISMLHGIKAVNESFRVDLKLYSGLSFSKMPGKTFYSHDDVQDSHCRCNNGEHSRGSHMQ